MRMKHETECVREGDKFLFVSFQAIRLGDGTYVHRLKPSGTPVTYDCVQNQLKDLLKACREAGVEMPGHVGLHSFRVGAINHMDSDGVDMQVIQKQARHMDINTTVGYVGNYHSNVIAGAALSK